MWHIVFNYHDYHIQLRLIATAAACVCIMYLGIWEFSSRVKRRQALLLGSAIVLGCTLIAYILALLNGAA